MSRKPGTAAWELETDWASLANQAAIDVDNIVIGKDPVHVEGVARLSALLADSITKFDEPHTSTSGLNPENAVVLHLAINDSSFDHVTQLNELLARARQITGLFDSLVANPTEFSRQHADLLPKIRLFCLALSKRALAASNFAFEERPPHPFRR